MDESAYHRICDSLFADIELMLEEGDADCCHNSGVLEVETEAGNKIIVSRQPALREIWVAEKSGGRHFQLAGGEWTDTVDGKLLLPYLRSLL